MIFAPFDREGEAEYEEILSIKEDLLWNLPVGEYGDDRDRLMWMLDKFEQINDIFPDIDNLGEEWNDFFGEVNVSYEQAEQWDDFFDIVDDYVTEIASLLNAS